MDRHEDNTTIPHTMNLDVHMHDGHFNIFINEIPKKFLEGGLNRHFKNYAILKVYITKEHPKA